MDTRAPGVALTDRAPGSDGRKGKERGLRLSARTAEATNSTRGLKRKFQAPLHKTYKKRYVKFVEKLNNLYLNTRDVTIL